MTSSTASSVFIDTNVFAYQFDDAAGRKQVRAREVIAGAEPTVCISTQVLLELHSFLTRKLGTPRAAATAVLEAMSYEVIPTDRALLLRAAVTAADHQLSIWDALILEAAVEAGCSELWTEDLTDGATLRGVRIVNPLS